MNRKIIIFTIINLIAGFAYGQQTIIHAGTLIDGKSKKVLKKQSIIIEDGIIKSVKKGYIKNQTDDIVIDLKSLTTGMGFFEHEFEQMKTVQNNQLADSLISEYASKDKTE